MIIINFLLLLTIIDIHILTSLTYNSTDLQACYFSDGQMRPLGPPATPSVISAAPVTVRGTIIFNGNGAVYKDLNLARASRRAINSHVTC